MVYFVVPGRQLEQIADLAELKSESKVQLCVSRSGPEASIWSYDDPTGTIIRAVLEELNIDINESPKMQIVTDVVARGGMPE